MLTGRHTLHRGYELDFSPRIYLTKPDRWRAIARIVHGANQRAASMDGLASRLYRIEPLQNIVDFTS